MNGSRHVTDTNIALYLLRGDKTVVDLLYDKGLHLSVITHRWSCSIFPACAPAICPAYRPVRQGWIG